MEPDDEVVFGRALDESRARFEQIQSLRAASAGALPLEGSDRFADLILAMAAFELHGSTLHRLAQWYPKEERVRLAALEWELSNTGFEKPAWAYTD